MDIDIPDYIKSFTIGTKNGYTYGYDIIQDTGHPLGRQIKFWHHKTNMSWGPNANSQWAYQRNKYDPVTIGLKRDVAEIKRAMAAQQEISTRTTTVVTTGTTIADIQHISSVQAGDGNDERTGNKIKSFSISIKGSIRQGSSAVFTTCRFLLFQDRLNTGTAPTVAQLFSTEATFYEGQNKRDDVQISARFNILWDKLFVFENTSHRVEEIDYYKKYESQIFFTGNASTDEGKNTIWLMVASNEASATPVITANTVFKFTE